MARKEIARTEIFENMPVYRAILTLAIPNVINQLANVIYNLADTFYIGRLNNSSMVAAITITAPVVLILTALSNLFCVGSCAVIAAALGSKNKKKAEDIATLAPIMAFASGIVISVITLIFSEKIALYSGASETSLVYTKQYQFWVISLNAVPSLCSTTIGAGLRGRGYSKYEMYGITLGNVLNIILDPIFIFVFDLGVIGAASATFLSSFISMLFFFYIANKMQKREHLYTPFKEFRFNKDYIGQVLSMGFPAFLNSFLTSFANTIQMNTIKTYSDAAVASVGLVRKIEHTFGQIIVGICQGIIPLLSYNYASKNYSRLKEITKKSLILGATWGLMSVFILFPFAETFMRIFINDPATVEFGIPLVKMFSFMPFLMCPNNNFRTLMQCLGRKKTAALYTLMRTFMLFVPLVIILNKLFGFYGATFSALGSYIIGDLVGIPIVTKIMKKAKAECEAASDSI